MTDTDLLELETHADVIQFRRLADKIQELPKVNARTGKGEELMDYLDGKIQALFDEIYQITGNF